MKIEIYCKSKRNTKKVATAIGKELMVTPKTITGIVPDLTADILFVGCGIYAGSVPPIVKEFIEGLDPQKVNRVVLFFTSGSGEDQSHQLKEIIRKCGIKVDENVLNLKGQFFLFKNRKQPDEAQLKIASEFARKYTANKN